MKKFAVLLSLVLALAAFAGCNNNDFKVALVATDGEVKDGGFNQLAFDALDGYSKTELEVIGSGEKEFSARLDDALALSPDIIWISGSSYSSVTESYAAVNPGVSFAVLDKAFSGVNQNLAGIVFKDYESAFLAGYIAAKTTETGRLGFLGAYDNETVNAFLYGFRAGALYAADEDGTAVNFETEYTGSYVDKEAGRSGAESLYNRGCDVIFQAADACGTGAVEVAAEQDKWIIGSDYDQTELAPGNVLTCVTKNPQVAVNEIMESFVRGRVIGGKNYEYGLKKNGVGIIANNGNVAEEVYTAMETVKSKIISGEIKAPKTMAELTAFSSAL